MIHTHISIYGCGRKIKMKMETKTKKKIYVGLTIFLGIMLSFIAHALLEVAILRQAFAEGRIVEGTYFLRVGWCALPFWVQYTFPVLGIVGGYFLGQYWWKVVYIQKRHWRFKKK